MNNETLIREIVESFVTSDKSFTSVDISNKIKLEKGIFVRNIEVRDWLRTNLKNDDMFVDYTTTSINVMNDTRKATLYHPNWISSDSYKNRDQRALTPTDILAKKINGSAVANHIVVSVKCLKRDTRSRVIHSFERIKIPSAFIKKLGWQPGQTIDPSKIKTHTPISTRLIVNKDYRLSIPRKSINWGNDPVKVILNTDHIAFERA